MKFIEIVKILCKKYHLSASEAAESASQLKSDLMAFKKEEDVIKFLENLERVAFKGHDRG